MTKTAGTGSSAAAIAGQGWQTPDWPAPDGIGALVTTRPGGHSLPPYDSFNLGTHVGDDTALVLRNRRLLRSALPELGRLQWLEQVHGNRVVSVSAGDAPLRRRKADAACILQPGDGVAILTADCLPVLFCSRDGQVAAAAHAGWRGLKAGVLENTVLATGRQGSDLMAWLGPAIGPCCFEVGDEVQSAFLAAAGPGSGSQAITARAFAPVTDKAGKSFMDIYAVARQRLLAVGVTQIHGAGQCTVCDDKHFYSYRRAGVTGRMASLIYLKGC
jgi:YfiH family protein